MNKVEIKSAEIPGLRVLSSQRMNDSRGYFERLYCQETLSDILNGNIIRQINRTLTQKKGTVRGLHFQYPPHAETKIVTCIRGKVWDVAVDLRKGSPSFLKYHSILLTENNYQSFVIPEGFAHGFQTLSNNCEMLYFHTADYNTEAEGSVNAKDPILGINWPEPILELSKRDKSTAFLRPEFKGISV